MKKMLLFAMMIGLCVAGLTQAQTVNLTGNTLFSAAEDGTVLTPERWHTYSAPGPAWNVFVLDGAIPGNTILNKTDGVAPDRTIDIPLTVGNTYTFTFGVSHTATGDLGFDYYGLNLFFDKDPLIANWDEGNGGTVNYTPDISVYAQPDRDGPMVGTQPAFMANSAAATMGYPIYDKPGAGTLVYSSGTVQVTLTDYVLYAKSAGLGLDYESATTTLGPFIPDTYPDVIGEYTLVVTPEPMTMALLGLGSLALIRRRR
jgi:hypothetical protein